MAGFDILDISHSTLFTSWIRSKVSHRWWKLSAFVLCTRVEALDTVVLCNGCEMHRRLLIWNGEGKDDE